MFQLLLKQMLSCNILGFNSLWLKLAAVVTFFEIIKCWYIFEFCSKNFYDGIWYFKHFQRLTELTYNLCSMPKFMKIQVNSFCRCDYIKIIVYNENHYVALMLGEIKSRSIIWDIKGLQVRLFWRKKWARPPRMHLMV